MKLGIHVSVAGSIDQSIDRAVELGCNTFQIFISNPRGWKPTIIDDKTVKLFRKKYITARIESAVSHSIYLINLASPKDYFRELSIESLISGLITSEKLGLSGLVTHIGSHQGDGLKIGLERVIEALNQVLSGATCCLPLLLENTAGAGNLIGKNFTEIGEIMYGVKSSRLGLCLDTAHAFEYGYEIHTARGLEKLIQEIDKNIGLNKLKVIHLNDSMTELGSNKDRHEEFGDGCIGKENLIRIINHPKLKNLPFIMETPKLKAGEKGREFIEEIKSYSK